MTMSSVSRRLSEPWLGRNAQLLVMEGACESVLMAKVQSPHLLPFAQENSRSRDGLPVSMCGPMTGRLCAQLDSEDNNFDNYQRARDIMHLSGLRMLPEQEVPESNVHLWQLVRQASNASNGAAIREFACPMRHMCKCKVGLRIVEGQGFMQLERFRLHDKDSHVIQPQPAFLGTFQRQ